MPGPLEGVSVIEFAGLGPAPYACTLLAELGAEVIRIDRPGGSGLGSSLAPGLNRSRPNVAVDLKSPDGVEVVLRLVDQADVVVEGFRPGVTERLGLGPDVCLARNPGLVYARMTGWGQEGPLAQRAGHDINYAAITGLLHVIGERDKPRQPVNIGADFGGGSLFLVAGILAALVSRGRTGTGQVVDAAMVDGAASLITMLYSMRAAGSWKDEREANLLDGGAPFYDTYRCKDGKYVAVGCIEPQFYAAMIEGLGITPEGGQYDESAWPAHRAAFTEVFATKTRDEWDEVFRDTDACVAPVLSLDEAPSHPHMAARGIFAQSGGGLMPAVAPRFSATPGMDATPPRNPGADTADVLLSWGFAESEVDALLEAKVVAQAPSADDGGQ